MSFLEEDIESIANYNLPWNKLINSTILVTGATGLIGSLLVKALNRVNIKKRLNLKIIALVRNIDKAMRVFDDCEVEFIVQDIRNKIINVDKVDFIVHCAAITKSKDMTTYPVELIHTEVFGTENVLELAKEKKVKSIVYISSMEVYGQINKTLGKVSEDELGYLNMKSVRSCYPESKRICECLCISYYSEYNVPIKIARLAQTFGAGVSKDDTRVFAQFAKSVIQEKDIILHTDGKSVGNYCYTADVIKGILILLLNGVNGEIYNISNEDTNMTILEMAELVSNKIAGGKISLVINKDSNMLENLYAPPVIMKLSSDKIRKLGWQPEYGIEEMYHRMIGELLGE